MCCVCPAYFLTVTVAWSIKRGLVIFPFIETDTSHVSMKCQVNLKQNFVSLKKKKINVFVQFLFSLSFYIFSLMINIPLWLPR